MTENRKVIKIFYGPYEKFGILNHKPQRLYGLKAALEARNFFVDIIPTNIINKLTVEYNDRIVFRCDVRNLKFNMPFEYDNVCQRAVRVILEVHSRMSKSTNRPQFKLLPKPPKDRSLVNCIETNFPIEYKDVHHWELMKFIPKNDDSM